MWREVLLSDEADKTKKKKSKKKKTKTGKRVVKEEAKTLKSASEGAEEAAEDANGDDNGSGSEEEKEESAEPCEVKVVSGASPIEHHAGEDGSAGLFLDEDDLGEDDLVEYLQSTGSILALAQKLGF